MTPGSDHETVGERIRRLRRERGLSLRDVATTGVSYTYLSRVESGDRTPSVKAIRALARKLGVTPEYLESGVELHAREELELTLSDLELAVRLEPERYEIVAEFRRVAQRADAEGAEDIAIRARASLGVALASRGELTEAATVLEIALSHPTALATVFTEAYATLAQTYRDLGRGNDAVALCRRALAGVSPTDQAVRVVLATYLSYALADIGEFKQAEKVLAEVAEYADGADPYNRARLQWTLARVEAMQDKRRLALHHMRKAITLLQGTEDTLLVARAHLLCAQILLWGGRVEGVAFHLRSARTILPPHAGPDDRAWVDALGALLEARKGHPQQALALAERALAGHGPGVAAANYAKGLALAAEEQFDAADAAYGEALELLDAGRLWREASMVAADRGRACRRAGNESSAQRWRQRAEEYGTRLGGNAVPSR